MESRDPLSCSSCGVDKSSSDYSSNQLRKRDRRRCKACIEQEAVAAASSPSSSSESSDESDGSDDFGLGLQEILKVGILG